MHTCTYSIPDAWTVNDRTGEPNMMSSHVCRKMMLTISKTVSDCVAGTHHDHVWP